MCAYKYVPCLKYPVWNALMKKIAVIGAGLSGLTFATKMNSIADVTVFEKSKGIGGRMATRYANDYEFDHGAQYFTAKSSVFQSFLKPYIKNGVIKDWNPNLVTLSHNGMTQRISNYPSYVASPKMNSLGKALAKGLNLVGETHIDKLSKNSGSWSLVDSQAHTHGPFDFIVLAIPSQQAATLLPPDFAHLDAVSMVKMEGCFSLMLGFEKRLDLGFEGAFVENSSIGWISVNSSKPERAKGFSMMIQSHNTWAETHINDDKAEVQKALLDEGSVLLGQDLTNAQHQVLHRWLYASTSKSTGKPFLLDKQNAIASIGDWCIKGRVEAAFESGFLLSKKLHELI